MLPCGYPSIPLYQELVESDRFAEMSRFAGAFIEANADALAYYAQRWVKNPIHNWSRRWEYMYVYERIAAFAEARPGEALTLLDAGSGLTFFPHYVASRHPGVSIACGDSDARLYEDAQRLGPPASDRVRYSVQDIERLGYEDGAFNLIYCLSVLEHCRYPGESLKHLYRTLKPGGRLILTIDVSLDGQVEIPVRLAARLIQMLVHRFKPDGRYDEQIGQFQPAEHVSTEWARRIDVSLLPWAPPRFHLLSFFCMSFTRPET